ncbi:MAG TPA: hypothetical protein VGP38_08005, partial [Rubrobacter sp.]|nr:hypothetical protein [Rubrobacter sp.]
THRVVSSVTVVEPPRRLEWRYERGATGNGGWLEPFSKRTNLSEKRAISNQPKQNRTLRADRVFKEGHPL